MPVGDLDAISHAIGQLQNEAESARRDRIENGHKLDRIGECVKSFNGISDRIDALEGSTASYRRDRNRVIGFGLALAVISGATGGWIESIFSKLFGLSR